MSTIIIIIIIIFNIIQWTKGDHEQCVSYIYDILLRVDASKLYYRSRGKIVKSWMLLWFHTLA